MKDVIKMVIKAYPAITKDLAEGLINEFKDRIIRIYELDELKAMAIYFKITDTMLAMIRNKQIDITNAKDFLLCMKMNGNNIHFFSCTSSGAKYILRGMKVLIKKENPITVSWFSPDMKKFFIRRLKCHQQR